MDNLLWLIVGFGAQLCFSLRFIIQWVISERKKRSVVPLAFWYFSIFGGFGLLIYSIHIKDPVFILGQSCGIFIYFRNLILLKRRKTNFSPCRNK